MGATPTTGLSSVRNNNMNARNDMLRRTFETLQDIPLDHIKEVRVYWLERKEELLPIVTIKYKE